MRLLLGLCLSLACPTAGWSGERPVPLAVAGGALRATIAPDRGGELSSLQYRRHGAWVELLYRGGDYSPTDDWTGHAPLLWPATGRTQQGASDPPAPTWTHDGRTLTMPIHGFARDRAWRVVGRGSDRLTVALTDDAASRAIYPFGFRLWCAYRLRARSIELRYSVVAARDNKGAMPFSIGNHVTFALPLVPGSAPGAMTVETPARLMLPVDQAGRPTGKAVPESRFTSPQPLSGMPVRQPIPLGGYAGDPWLRLRDPGGVSLIIRHRGAPRAGGTPVAFNLWGDVGKGFFSPEPWLGRQNALVTGDGLVQLPPGQRFGWTVVIALDVAKTGRAAR
jgi:galactose mutarotase-like enzyme